MKSVPVIFTFIQRASFIKIGEGQVLKRILECVWKFSVTWKEIIYLERDNLQLLQTCKVKYTFVIFILKIQWNGYGISILVTTYFGHLSQFIL